MNSFSLVGALTKDPVLKGEGEARVCRLRLVEAGGHPDHPLYINVSVFGGQAGSCHEHLRKGRQVAVVGRLCFREWQRVDLARRSEYWIAADRVDFLARPPAPVETPEPTTAPA
jgi:single-stranded DNA-binding protein